MNKRLDILEREEDIRQWIKDKKPKSFMCAELNCKSATLNSYLKKMGIEYKGNSGLKGYQKTKINTPIEVFLNNEKTIQTNTLRKRLIKEGYKEYKCERCGLTEWQGQPIPLELHHEDGNHFNNQLINLKLLCPNCHALTDGYRGRGTQAYKNNPKKNNIKMKKINYCVDCHRAIDRKAVRCKSCAGKEKEKEKIKKHPNRELLKQLIRTKSFVQIGRKFGVTDNTIRKWCKKYQLPYSSKEIKNYSNEEWDNI